MGKLRIRWGRQFPQLGVETQKSVLLMTLSFSGTFFLLKDSMVGREKLFLEQYVGERMRLIGYKPVILFTIQAVNDDGMSTGL